jgi:hypothetical protein
MFSFQDSYFFDAEVAMEATVCRDLVPIFMNLRFGRRVLSGKFWPKSFRAIFYLRVMVNISSETYRKKCI